MDGDRAWAGSLDWSGTRGTGAIRNSSADKQLRACAPRVLLATTAEQHHHLGWAPRSTWTGGCWRSRQRRSVISPASASARPRSPSPTKISRSPTKITWPGNAPKALPWVTLRWSLAKLALPITGPLLIVAQITPAKHLSEIHIFPLFWIFHLHNRPRGFYTSFFYYIYFVLLF